MSGGTLPNFEGGGVAFSMRRNDNDRRPPRRVLTAFLMGDPRPDRLERAEALRLSWPRVTNYGPAIRSGGGRD
ncbi:hypothetical protein [Caulobacter sp. DWR3-1-2]|uniref:hypothetical protein n=1 Tax=Caulobacter sp. DWR3-1-2 TaxID=2804647 RepID=UPI003CF3B485